MTPASLPVVRGAALLLVSWLFGCTTTTTTHLTPWFRITSTHPTLDLGHFGKTSDTYRRLVEWKSGDGWRIFDSGGDAVTLHGGQAVFVTLAISSGTRAYLFLPDRAEPIDLPCVGRYLTARDEAIFCVELDEKATPPTVAVTMFDASGAKQYETTATLPPPPAGWEDRVRSLDTAGVVAGDRVAVENWSFGHGRRLRRVFRVEPTGSVTLINEGAFDY